MSLNFGGAATDRMACGTDTSLENLDPVTIVGWIRPETQPSVITTIVWQKGVSFPNAQFVQLVGSSGRFGLLSQRSANSCAVTATYGNYAAWGTNKWLFFACQTDTTNVANCRSFVGDASTLAAQPSSYAVQQVGSGTVFNNAGAVAYMGNKSTFDVPFDGDIAFLGIWDRILSTGEINDQQFFPHKTSGCVYFNYPGFAGNGTQPDWSGNSANNGSVTGATVSTGAPIAMPFNM